MLRLTGLSGWVDSVVRGVRWFEDPSSPDGGVEVEAGLGWFGTVGSVRGSGKVSMAVLDIWDVDKELWRLEDPLVRMAVHLVGLGWEFWEVSEVLGRHPGLRGRSVEGLYSEGCRGVAALMRSKGES